FGPTKKYSLKDFKTRLHNPYRKNKNLAGTVATPPLVVKHVRFSIRFPISCTNHASRFVDSNVSVAKICNPSGSNPAGFCQHTLD
ncbi:hypothetical protein EDB84DRAFT_1278441, partial [Lactarius hengduanensis]